MNSAVIRTLLLTPIVYFAFAQGSELTPKKHKNGNAANATSNADVPAATTPATSPPPPAGHPTNDQNRITGHVTPDLTYCTARSIDALLGQSIAWHPWATATGVYFLSDRDGKTQVYFLAKPGGLPTAISHLERGVENFKVNRNETYLLATSNDVGSHSRLFLIDLRSHETISVSSDVTGMSWGNEKWFLFAAGKKDSTAYGLLRYEIASKKITHVAELPGISELRDVSPDLRFVVLTQWLGDQKTKIATVDLETRRLFTFPIDVDEHPDAISFSADGRSILLERNRRNHRRQISRVVRENPTALLPVSTENDSVETPSVNEAHTRLAYALRRDARLSFAVFELLVNGERGKRIPINAEDDSYNPSSGSESKNPRVFFVHAENNPQIWGGSEQKIVPWTDYGVPPSLLSAKGSWCPSEWSVFKTPSPGDSVPALFALKLPSAAVIYLPSPAERPKAFEWARLANYFVDRGISFTRFPGLFDDTTGATQNILSLAQALITNHVAHADSLFLYGEGIAAQTAFEVLAQPHSPFAAAALANPEVDLQRLTVELRAMRTPLLLLESQRPGVTGLYEFMKTLAAPVEIKTVPKEGYDFPRSRLERAVSVFYFFDEKRKKGP